MGQLKAIEHEVHLDIPTGTTDLSNGLDNGIGEQMVGGEAIVTKLFAGLLMDYGQVAPVNLEGILTQVV